MNTEKSTEAIAAGDKLIRVAALSVALLIVGVFIYLGRSNVKNVENTLTQTKKQYLLDLLRVEIKAFQAATDQIGADLSLLGTALLAGENGDAPANITVALGSIVHLREHFNLMVETVYLTKTNGDLVEVPLSRKIPEAESSLPHEAVRNLMQTYFSRQEKLRGMHLLADTVKSKDHEAAVLLSVPVYDGQKLKGLISAKIPVEALRRVILTGAAHSAVCLLLLDSDGTILLSSEDPRLTGRNFLLDGRMELSANARAGLHRFARIVHSGEMRSATYSGPEWTKLLFKSGKVIAGHGAVRAGGQKWPLVLTVDYEDVHQPVKQHARSIFVSIEFIVLSLIGVIWLLHKSQERRLELEISARSAAALKAAYDKLQSSEELLRQVLDASPVCIYAADTSGRVLLANNSFGNLVRMKPEKTIGRTVVECALSAGTLPEYASRLIAEDRNVIALQEELHLSERRCQMTDGTVRWFQISKTPLVLNGKAEFVLGIIADITSRIVEQENREKLEAQLQHMQKMESLGVLAGGVAHDFNNLLACIVGNAEMAISELDADSMAYECLQQISAAAERAGALADQMLAYSGKGQFSVAPIDLSKLIREMGHLLRTSISKKTKLNFDLADALPVFVGDSAQISQVVMNLMLNGAEALEGEYGTISIATGTMHCTKKDFTTSYIAEELPEGEYAFVEIKDTGCGMDDETLRKIFDPFFTTKFFGRGLGLAAALGIIRGHHGAVWIDSSPGKGTTFRVCFPAAAVCAVGRPANKERTAKSSSPATVLIIDDEEMVLGVAGKILRQAGYKVVTASDGHEALTRLKHAGMEIQLVILDLNMPEISGREILAEIRKLSSEMRVILSSGYSEESVLDDLKDDLHLRFIKKPYRPGELAEQVRHSLTAG